MPSWKEIHDNLRAITRTEIIDLITNAVSERGSEFGIGKDMGRKYVLNLVEILGKSQKPMSLRDIKNEMILSSALNVARSSRNKTLRRCLRFLEETGIVGRWIAFEGEEYKRKDYYLAYRLTEEENEKISKEGVNQVLLKLFDGLDSQNKILKKIKEHMEKEDTILDETRQVVTVVKNRLEQIYHIKFS